MTKDTACPVVLPDSPIELMAVLRATVDRLGSAVWTAETEDALLAAERDLETARRAAEGVDAQLFTEINDRCAYTRDGFCHPITFLAKGLRLGRGEARKRYRRAAKIARLTSMTGQTMDPKLPATAAAVAQGTISAAHVDEIAEVIAHIPHRIPEDVVATAETDLAAMATQLTPWEVRKAGIALLSYLDPDGSLSDDRDRAGHRRLSLAPQDRELMTKLTGQLTPALRAKFELVLANYAAPGMNNPADTAEERLGGSVTDIDPDNPAAAERLTQARRRDHRSPTQRNHDALEAMCDYLTGHGGLGSPRTIPGQFIVTATIADLKAGCGQALTTTGALIPVGDLVHVAAQLDPSLVVFRDHTREILYHGRAKRSATFAQRCALFARDRGDTNPDSDVPFIHTQAHHLPDWAKGGATDIDKLTPTSGPNNRNVGGKPYQWDTGLQGTPRVNNTHHPHDLARNTIKRIRHSRGKGTAHADPPNTTNQPNTETRLTTRLGYTEL
jgi:hypothetical protein